MSVPFTVLLPECDQHSVSDAFVSAARTAIQRALFLRRRLPPYVNCWRFVLSGISRRICRTGALQLLSRLETSASIICTLSLSLCFYFVSAFPLPSHFSRPPSSFLPASRFLLRDPLRSLYADLCNPIFFSYPCVSSLSFSASHT